MSENVIVRSDPIPLVGVRLTTHGKYSPEQDKTYRIHLSRILGLPSNIFRIRRGSIVAAFVCPVRNLESGVDAMINNDLQICDDVLKKGEFYVS
tara:strand:+ start:334 stop:615 length:282 start_codon:yes stop_codon:yes gene_type:complete